ncbi:MAG: HD domain-containing protein, partial [Sphingobacteriia bacterium]
VLIYDGVRHGLHLSPRTDYLFMDIGGGSVEFVVGDRRYPKLIRSLNLGGARLLEHLQPQDPMTRQDIIQAETYLAEQLDPLMQEVRSFGIKQLIGSSGTFETLGTVIAHQSGNRLMADMVNAYQFSVPDFLRLHQDMIRLDRTARLALPGMDPVRVEMINMGSLLVQHVVQSLGIETITVSTFALKEGILFNFIAERTSQQVQDPQQMNVRSSAVEALAEKYKYDAAHARQTSQLALQLFDQLAGLHHYSTEERELLHYAALLHDIGHFVDRSGHHKHGQYIIMNSKLPGFSSDELLLMANMVRYHRRSIPSYEHMHYNLLYKEDKQKVMVLGGMLRLAVNLDRAHRGLVQRLELRLSPSKLSITVYSPQDVELEIRHAREATDMLQQALDRKIELQAQLLTA